MIESQTNWTTCHRNIPGVGKLFKLREVEVEASLSLVFASDVIYDLEGLISK